MLSMQASHNDGLHLEDAINETTFTRRSLSIFSRRGPDTPVEPQVLTTRSYKQPRTYALNNRPSLRTTISKGTILHAVPQESASGQESPPPLRHSTIHKSSPLDRLYETASAQVSDLKREQKRWSTHNKNRSTDDRIGVWVNGIVQWDETVKSTDSQIGLPERPKTSHSTPRRRADTTFGGHRPSLSVVIPKSPSAWEDRHVAALPTQSQRRAEERPPTRSSRKHDSEGSSRLGSPSGSIRSKYDSLKKSQNAADLRRIASAASLRDDPSRSSSNASSSATKEDASTDSKRSSLTSVEGTSGGRRKTRSRAVSTADSTTHVYIDKPLPPVPPIADALQQSPSPPLPAMEAAYLKFPVPPKSSKSLNKKKDHPLRKSSTLRRMKSTTKLDEFDQEFMKSSPYIPTLEHSTSEPSSPTSDQPKDDLMEPLARHLSLPSLQARSKPEPAEVVPHGLGIFNCQLPSSSEVINDTEESIAVNMQPISRAPTIPKKSRRRDWRRSTSSELKLAEVLTVVPARRLSDSMTPVNDAPPGDWWTKHRMTRSVSSATPPKLGLDQLIERPPLPSRFALDDGLIVVDGPVLMRPSKLKIPNLPAAQESAEGVLVHILASLTSIDDLMNTMLINKGMHRVYMENEMRLIKAVCRNQSPAAWELREWCPPKTKSSANATADGEEEEDDFVQYTPTTYLRSLKHDAAIIEQLKEVIVAECSSFVRKDTLASMCDPSHPEAQRMTDAIWRIWTFCSIFGSRKGRDEDLSGQLDWLKGGRVANNLDCAATVNVQFDFDMASILLNAPDYFGQGNGQGLSADQLYDITEVWTCMAVLLQGYLGRVDQAREYGVYDNCTIEKGDVEAEEYMLEEWVAWIMTFGPTAVLEMAQYASDPTATGFHLAQERGWTQWAPPMHTASRVTFLKEPVTRLYQERVTAAHAKAQNARDQEEKMSSRRRIAAHALEIKIRRQDSAFRRVPLIDMSMERPMSIMSTLSGGGPLTPRFPPRMMTLPALPPPVTVHPALRLNPNALRSPTSPSSLSSRPDGREALRQLNGVAVDTTELAIQRIVTMGFSEAQAIYALKTTDTGDGLRVDRAVDMLLRSHNVAPEWA